MTTAWTVAALTRRHDRASFDCGNEPLNNFLRLHARQNQSSDVSRMWVATASAGGPVLGFYTLAAGSVARQLLEETDASRLPRYPVPVAHLGRLAVDLSTRGRGLGAYLLIHALEQVFRVSTTIGLYAVEVHAKDASARGFYRHHGFIPMLDDENHLYLSMRSVRRLFSTE